MSTKVQLALCQMEVTSDKNANIEKAKSAVQEAAQKGADIVVLPEMWNCPYANTSFPIYAEQIVDGSNEDVAPGVSPSVDCMKQMARMSSITLVGGSIPEQSEGKLYNTCCVFNTEGKLLAKHRKVHLFDIDIPGKITFRESDTLSAGAALTVVDLPGIRLGLGICYDIRFPEMAMLYAKQGAQLLIYPGAFNMTTGPVHWELLTKSRAVDNQLFVATCSPARNAGAEYQAWGHSTIVGPFGETLATCDHTESIVHATLQLEELTIRRKNMPLEQQKRPDLYATQAMRPSHKF